MFALYHDEILLAQKAVTSGRTTFLTGGDADAHRTIASLFLPTASHDSCLLAGADGGLALLSLVSSTASLLILHDADAPHTSAALVALLDASTDHPLVATAATTAGVPKDVREAHKLDVHVHLRLSGARVRSGVGEVCHARVRTRQVGKRAQAGGDARGPRAGARASRHCSGGVDSLGG